MGDKVGDKSGGETEMSQSLNHTQQRILSEIRNNPNITKTKLVEVIKLGKTTIDKGISELKKKGYIERVGSNKNGYWNVLKY